MPDMIKISNFIENLADHSDHLHQKLEYLEDLYNALGTLDEFVKNGRKVEVSIKVSDDPNLGDKYRYQRFQLNGSAFSTAVSEEIRRTENYLKEAVDNIKEGRYCEK